MRYTEQGNLHVYHWGTKILCLGSLKSSKPTVKGFYGQSKSDRDALQFCLTTLKQDTAQNIAHQLMNLV